jgi:asparagine synthase (glutamine-hydrolysing)
MKRFVRSGSLPPDQCYLGFISIMSRQLMRKFFKHRERFAEYRETCGELVLNHFNSANIDEADSSLNRAFYCDIKTYLPEDILAVTDRMSMHHALEVRVPFVDHKLLEFSATIPPEIKMRWLQKKYLLKKAARSLLPKKVVDHRKQGFVGPMSVWLKKGLRPFVIETLSESKLKRHDLIDPKVVKMVLDEHFAGKEIHDTLIWAMLIFQKWFDSYIEKETQ